FGLRNPGRRPLVQYRRQQRHTRSRRPGGRQRRRQHLSLLPGDRRNAAGDVGMTYMRSGTDSATDYMSMYVTARQTCAAAGTMTALVTSPGGTLAPRLVLNGPNGPVSQSDDGTLVQHLLPGSYSLTVSAQAGTGSYQLTTEFVQASVPHAPVPAGSRARTV